MDTFSHALWGRGLFGYGGHPRMALFFGAMPDLFSFGILIVMRILSGDVQFGNSPVINTIPDWVYINYDITHSFVSAFICIGIVYQYRKDLAFSMLGWPFHILLDFPFHSKEFFPTKLFWPITDFSFDGIPWSKPEIWFPNLAGIILLFIYRKYKC
ncbi:MAG: hypothetical protein HN657_03540 [Candidatus Marinimicrobia bacterium]|jgi:membrane-bound metal-dependent hydrolase YbcI (DUF457 family)|nr:hypothetical protein [Candidatus Neomarinimicrobiota bacterium]MBT3496898.1 hypothetical protein [Candidatus Neomarinimicrobiota bacterium]MBT3692354.1 hypothetical protein [Candidatus Neomarinimicrobiota bacterium]MBT3732535.1 hypothetical protein [Candidatus Neomarinimicrobiota bacterium]MBT4144816.1 hypothetical protein [Candidatus Neomarinimicrobiota bacterium]